MLHVATPSLEEVGFELVIYSSQVDTCREEQPYNFLLIYFSEKGLVHFFSLTSDPEVWQ